MGERVCVDCGGEMMEGFLVDMTHKVMSQSHWHPGTPKPLTIFGIKVSPYALKYSKEKFRPITAYRCETCGLTKLYS